MIDSGNHRTLSRLENDDRRNVIFDELQDGLRSALVPAQDGGMSSATTTDTVSISAEFTSDVQRNAVMKVLRSTLAAWQRAAEEAHKETKITITYGNETKPS